jgi:two-component system, sensor histidine kinase and response regulator
MYRLLKMLVNIGVTNDVIAEEVRKTKILNIICIISTPVIVFYLFKNSLEGLYPVAAMNVFLLIRNLFFFYFNYKHKYYHARILLSLSGTISLSLGAIWFENGSEYYLLVNMVVVGLILQKQLISFTLIPLNAILFVAIKFYIERNPAIYIVPHDRLYANIILSTVLLAVVVVYYMNEQIRYYNDMLKANNRLNQQNNMLAEQKDQLEVMNTTKEKLFSIVAHDMRSPISNLRHALSLTSQKMLSKEEFESISSALLVQVDQLQDNLMNLLQWSKAQLNGIQTLPVAFSVQQSIQEILHLFESNLQSKKLAVRVTGNNELFFFADPEHIKLVLRNILNNAIKFSYVGKQIEIAVTDSADKICISIRDEGTGIKEEKIKTLFSFDGTDSSYGTLNEKGTGLGLILCKEFIEKNNGSISVTSQIGKGTDFKLCLPKAAKKIPARKLTGITIEDI